MAALLFIIGLIALCLFPPLGVLLILLAVAWAILTVQVLTLRPRFYRRSVQIRAGDAPSPSRHHLTYIALEGGVVLVLAFGVHLLGVAFAMIVPFLHSPKRAGHRGRSTPVPCQYDPTPKRVRSQVPCRPP